MIVRDWTMRADGRSYHCTVPCTVLSVMQENGLLGDVYPGTEERAARQYFYTQPVFSACFDADAALLSGRYVFLEFDCLDTLCTVSLNGVQLGRADNFHRVWRFEVKEHVREGSNRIELSFTSALAYAQARMKELYVWGNSLENGTLPGISYVRKPYFTFGWDWCPPFPDAGILGEVRLTARDVPFAEGVAVRQEHAGGQVTLFADVACDARCSAESVLLAPDGRELGRAQGQHVRFAIAAPQLWWPNGYGAQPLYTLRTQIFFEGQLTEEYVQRIGLRTVALHTQRDDYGKAFTFVVNGVPIFAKGANVVPCDCLLWRDVRAREEALLRECVAAGFNMVRVWGGGYYASDNFYDLCDRLGILVWQDFMVACAHIRLDEALTKTILAEAEENVRRIRSHPSLALLCGNNEMEPCIQDLAARKNFPDADKIVADYLYLYEEALPALTARLAPQTAYWPSSPSAGTGFCKNGSPDDGDSHFWEVWGELKPVQTYTQSYFRFLSEFGFIALPSIHTIDAFSAEKDRNLFSEVMECHQKNPSGNAKLAYYLGSYFEYPADFSALVLATQYVQADALETAFSHLRANYGRCMGALIWQLNDAYPALSFSVIDYYGCRKPAFYAVRRACRSMTILARREGGKVTLTLVNETDRERSAVLSLRLADAALQPVWEETLTLRAQPFSVQQVFCKDFGAALAGRERECFFGYRLSERKKERARGALLFVAPKLFRWKKGEVRVTREGNTVTVCADVFKKFVTLTGDDEVKLSDNCFDIIDRTPVVVTLEQEASGALSARALDDIH